MIFPFFKLKTWRILTAPAKECNRPAVCFWVIIFLGKTEVEKTRGYLVSLRMGFFGILPSRRLIHEHMLTCTTPSRITDKNISMIFLKKLNWPLVNCGIWDRHTEENYEGTRKMYCHLWKEFLAFAILMNFQLFAADSSNIDLFKIRINNSNSDLVITVNNHCGKSIPKWEKRNSIKISRLFWKAGSYWDTNAGLVAVARRILGQIFMCGNF